jgi:hypothetical protein
VPDSPEGWRPRQTPEVIYGDPERYRNITNFLCGHVVAFALLGVAWLWFGPGSLKGADASTPWELARDSWFLCALSVGSNLLLARPWVSVGRTTGQVIVRNPMHEITVPGNMVSGLSGADRAYPVLTLRGGRRIRLLGIQQSTLMIMRGGSEELARMREHLQALASSSSEAPSATAYAERFAPVSVSASLLILGWVAWAFVTFA